MDRLYVAVAVLRRRRPPSPLARAPGNGIVKKAAPLHYDLLRARRVQPGRSTLLQFSPAPSELPRAAPTAAVLAHSAAAVDVDHVENRRPPIRLDVAQALKMWAHTHHPSSSIASWQRRRTRLG
jgi:hypothetical protein